MTARGGTMKAQRRIYLPQFSTLLFVIVAGIWCSMPAGAQTRRGEIEVLPTAQLVVSAQAKGRHHVVPDLSLQDARILLRRRPVEMKEWMPLQGKYAGMQLVFLIDDSVRSYMALQIPSLTKFINSLPASTEVAVGYMDNGHTEFSQKMTADHALAAKALRLPNGVPGVSGSPYFVLSDLAKHWPSQAKTLRRVVFMVTNGNDPYYMHLDMQDPYVDAAIADCQKAGIQVYSMYFRDIAFNGYGNLGTLMGQSYLLMVSTGTGGVAYTEALSSPVSFDPFLKEFRTSLDHQYLATFDADKAGLRPVQVKSNLSGVKLAAASRVYVPR